MEYQKAAAVLKTLIEKGACTQEKGSVMTAIGHLGWGALAESKIKDKGGRLEKSTE
jgi:hypothetical protein